MRGEFQEKITVAVTPEMARQLQIYCTVHQTKRSDAIRHAIAQMLRGPSQRTAPPTFDPERPL